MSKESKKTFFDKLQNVDFDNINNCVNNAIIMQSNGVAILKYSCHVENRANGFEPQNHRSI